MATARARASKNARRRPLTRQRVLETALRLVDEEGLDALTMRALGGRLGVEAMSVYNHVPGKDALRAGIVELLWDELERTTEPDSDWQRSMRSLATGLRRLAREHPHAFPLLNTTATMPLPGLRVLDVQLEALKAAGFDESRAVEILRTVFGFASGYATLELSWLAMPYVVTDGKEPDIDAVLALGRALPEDVSPRLARVAHAVCLCDTERQFEVGLEALLAGLDNPKPIYYAES